MKDAEIWHRALDRQYNLFGTSLSIFTAGLSVIGAIISSSNSPIKLSRLDS